MDDLRIYVFSHIRTLDATELRGHLRLKKKCAVTGVYSA